MVNDILYMEFADLNSAGISENTVWSAIYRKSSSWQPIKDPSDRRKVLIRYETLRQKYKDLIHKKYGDPYKYLKKQKDKVQVSKQKTARDLLPGKIETDSKDVAWFQKQRQFSKDDSYSLARSAAWLRFLDSIRGKTDARKYGFKDKRTLYKAAIYNINEEDTGLRVNNVRVIQRRIQQFRASGLDSLISGRYGNKNTEKLTPQVKAFLRHRYSDPHKPNIQQIYLDYLKEAAERKWPAVTYGAIYTYLNKPDVRYQCYMARHGVNAWRNQFEYIINTKRPTFADAIWEMDGTRFPIYYVDKEGNIRSDLYIYKVMDVYSEAVIGYCVGKTESSQVVFNALKDSCTNTMHKPYQLYYDNAKANVAREIEHLKKNLAKLGFPAEPYNSKSKIIESLIGRFQDQVAKFLDSWSGKNITAKKIDSRANPDHLKKIKKQLPNEQQALKQIELCLRAWNNTLVDGMRRIDRHETSQHPKRDELKIEHELELVNLFWLKKTGPQEKGILYTKEGITIHVNKQPYRYVVLDGEGLFDEQFVRKHIRERFEVYYDPDDLSHIHLYKDDKWVSEAWHKELMPRAIVDHEPGDRARLDKILRKRKNEIAYVKEANRRDQEYMESMGIAQMGFEHVFKDTLNDAESRLLMVEAGLAEEENTSKTLYESGEEGGIVE